MSINNWEDKTIGRKVVGEIDYLNGLKYYLGLPISYIGNISLQREIW